MHDLPIGDAKDESLEGILRTYTTGEGWTIPSSFAALRTQPLYGRHGKTMLRQF